MIETTFNPGLLIILGALFIPLVHGGARTALLFALPLVALVLVWGTVSGEGATLEFLNQRVQPFQSTALGRMFATAFIITLLTGNLFALGQARGFELACASFYAGSAVGVALCGDFLSLFVFWEMMALGSTAVILAGGTAAARAAGFRYFVLHILGGMLLLCGIVGLIVESGDTALRLLRTQDLYTGLILAGVLLNAGAPPFSAWLADAYPEATPAGAVYLSAFTTKSAVWVLIMVFAGNAILIPIGLYMVFYGIVYAINENDMRRILAYSIVNQVGVMVVGVGIGTELALSGAATHAFAHIIYKALLIMSAGSVLMMTARRNLTDLGGLYHSMRATTVCTIIGAMTIFSFPFTSGFVSKPMIGAAALEMQLVWLMPVLLVASACVMLHAGLKFPWFVFFQRDSGLRASDPPLNMRLAMYAFVLICILLGVFPQIFYAMLPWSLEYTPYTTERIVTQLQLLLLSGAAFFVLLPLLQCTRTVTLDLDWIYRRAGFYVYRRLWRDRAFGEILLRPLSAALKSFSCHLARWTSPADAPVKMLQTSTTVGWLTALLAVFLLIYFL